MNTETINQYLKDHPYQSDKKIARHFNLTREEIKNIREQNSCKFAKIRGNPITDGEKVASIDNALNTVISHPLLNGRWTYLNLFLLSLSLRLIYLYFLKQKPYLTTPLLDAQYYLEWAQRILKEGVIGSKAFFTEPFYAYLLALLIKFTPNAQFVLHGLQLILGSILPLIVTKIAAKVFNRKVAVISGFLTAVYGLFVFYDNLLLKTSLETFFLTLLVLVFVNVLESKKPLNFLLTGIFLGLITSLKGNVTTLVPAFALLVFLFLNVEIKKRILYIFLFGLGFLISISPLTVHNYLASKSFVLTNYSSGMFLYGGSWWGFDGGILAPPFIRPSPEYEEIDHYKMAESYLDKKLTPGEVASFWTQMGIKDIFSNLPRYLQLEWKKLYLLISKNELSDNYDYHLYLREIPLLQILPNFWLVGTLGLTGIFLLLFSKPGKNISHQRTNNQPSNNETMLSPANKYVGRNPEPSNDSENGSRETIQQLAIRKSTISQLDNEYPPSPFSRLRERLNSGVSERSNSGVSERLNSRREFITFLPQITASQKLLLLIIACYSGLILLGSVVSRYRIPVIPLFIIFASYAVTEIWEALKSASYHKLTFCFLLLAFFTIETSVPLDNFQSQTPGTYYNNLGGYYNDLGDFGKAEKYFQKTIEVDPAYSWAYSNLFTIYLKNGEFSLAKQNLAKILELRPDDMSTYYHLKLYKELNGKSVEFIQNRLNQEAEKGEGEKSNRYDQYFFEYLRYYTEGNLEKAAENLEMSVKKYDRPENSLINLAVIKRQQKDLEGAKKIYHDIIRKNPDFIAAKYNLGSILWNEKKYEEVTNLLKDVYDWAPEYGSGAAWYYLAAAYINEKNYDEALPLVNGYIKRYGNDPAKQKEVKTFKSLLVKNPETKSTFSLPNVPN